MGASMVELNDRDKLSITVLLAEYTAMRNQIISRGAGLIQLTSIGVACLTLVFVRPGSLYVNAILFLFLLAIVAMLWRFIWRDIDREAAHVRTLEARINALTGGLELLTWERHLGGARVGYTTGFWSFLPILIRTVRQHLPAITSRILRRPFRLG